MSSRLSDVHTDPAFTTKHFLFMGLIRGIDTTRLSS